jgi:hypothetical protein
VVMVVHKWVVGESGFVKVVVVSVLPPSLSVYLNLRSLSPLLPPSASLTLAVSLSLSLSVPPSLSSPSLPVSLSSHLQPAL